MKNKLKLFIFFIIIIIITGSISVYAATKYLASEIKYTGEKTVEEALNELYSNSKNINILDSDRAEYNIPTGIKEAYVFVSRGTTNIPYTISITGNGIVNTETISETNRGDVDMALYMEVYKITLSGLDGKIVLNSSGGNARYQAWNACVIY